MKYEIITIAKKLLDSENGGLESLRIWEFADDFESHDDQLIEQLYVDFSAEFDLVQTALTKEYGDPSSNGNDDADWIPLCGVLRFAIWSVGNKQLFAAVAHEDRGVPILLMLGTANEDDE